MKVGIGFNSIEVLFVVVLTQQTVNVRRCVCTAVDGTNGVGARENAVSECGCIADRRETHQAKVLAEGETWSRRLAYMFEMKRLTRSGGT